MGGAKNCVPGLQVFMLKGGYLNTSQTKFFSDGFRVRSSNHTIQGGDVHILGYHHILGCSKLNTCGTHREEPITKRVSIKNPRGTFGGPKLGGRYGSPKVAGGGLWLFSPGVSGRWKNLGKTNPNCLQILSFMTVAKSCRLADRHATWGHGCEFAKGPQIKVGKRNHMGDMGSPQTCCFRLQARRML